jgi:hypothetical protein
MMGKRRGLFPILEADKMRKYTLLALLMIFLSSHLLADTFSLSFYQYKTENLFQNIYGESDYLSNLSFYVDKNLSQFSIFTQGNYSYLFENPSLSYYIHDLGLDYLYPVNDKSAFYFSLTGKKTFFRNTKITRLPFLILSAMPYSFPLINIFLQKPQLRQK